MKNLLLFFSLIGIFVLLYLRSKDKADLYDASQRAEFFQNKVKESNEN